MNEKQKAKAYDEALEQAKKELAVSSPDSDSARQIFRFFPQLRESEDEKIRKALIEALKTSKTVGELKFILPEPTREKCIAYLEKQKDKMNAEEHEIVKVNNGIHGLFPPVGDGKYIDEHVTPDKTAEEKQKEQKPSINIEQLKSLMLQYLQEAANEKDDSDIEADTNKWARKILGYDFEQKEQKLHLTVSGKEVYKICPRCKSRMIRDDSKVYTSMPPQYGYKCPKCGEMEFDTIMYDNPEIEEQKPVDKFQEYLNASPAERRKMNMDEILGDNKGHQKTSDALTTDSNKEADTSDCKYKNLDEIAQDYVDGVKEYNPEPTWDLMQTAVCYGYHYCEQKAHKPELVQQPPITYTYPSDASRDERLKAALLALLNSDLIKVSGNKFTKQDLIEWVERIPTDKPAYWSEDDEEMIANIISSLRGYMCVISGSKNYNNHEAYIQKEIEFLNALRPSWKPTEKEITALENLMKGEFPDKIYPGATLSELLTKLKNLYYNNAIPSWKPSEDEERLIKTSISFLKDFADKGYENAIECIDWLKSKLNGNTCK